MELLDPFIDQLTTLRGPKAIIVFLIMLGYMVKMVPNKAIPNVIIPLLNCFVLGPLLTILLIGWPSSGEIDPEVRYPEFAAWAQAYQKGFLIGVIAWLAHGLILRKLVDDKVNSWSTEVVTVTKEEKLVSEDETTSKKTIIEEKTDSEDATGTMDGIKVVTPAGNDATLFEEGKKVL